MSWSCFGLNLYLTKALDQISEASSTASKSERKDSLEEDDEE